MFAAYESDFTPSRSRVGAYVTKATRATPGRGRRASAVPLGRPPPVQPGRHRPQHALGFLGRERSAVRPRLDHRAVRVAGGDDPARQRDLPSLEAVRVAAAVPALAVGAHYRGREGETRDLGELARGPLRDTANH